MTFDDLQACYITFKFKENEEVAQVVYEIMKLSKDQPTINRDDLIHFCKRIAQLNENFVNLYYKRTQMDPRIPIQRHEFIDAYHLVQDKNLFSIIPEIIEGFKNEHLNVDAD